MGHGWISKLLLQLAAFKFQNAVSFSYGTNT